MRCIGCVLAFAGYVFTAGVASALVISDFDGLDGGTASGGLNPLAVDTIGSGTCLDLVAGAAASGSALCGFDISDTDAPDDFATYTISGIDFDENRVLGFALAAGNTGSGDFEDTDYITVEANGVLVGSWAGGPSDTTDLLVNTGGGLVSGDLIPTFTAFSVPFGQLGSGTGDIVFTFFNTGNSEVFGLDQVETNVIPLPATLPLALVGLAALGLLARRRA